MSAIQIVCAVAVPLLWGYQFVAIKVGVAEFPPLFFLALRFRFLFGQILFGLGDHDFRGHLRHALCSKHEQLARIQVRHHIKVQIRNGIPMVDVSQTMQPRIDGGPTELAIGIANPPVVEALQGRWQCIG